MTKRDAVTAAMNLADDVAEGRVNVAELEHQAITELSRLALEPAEPGTEMAVLRVVIARRVLAEGGVPTDELAEWLAVQRRRENPDGGTGSTAVDGQGGGESADGADVLTDADSAALEPYSGEYAADGGELDPDAAEVAADLEPESVNPYGRNRRILARGRELPRDNGLRPL